MYVRLWCGAVNKKKCDNKNIKNRNTRVKKICLDVAWGQTVAARCSPPRGGRKITTVSISAVPQNWRLPSKDSAVAVRIDPGKGSQVVAEHTEGGRLTWRRQQRLLRVQVDRLVPGH